MNCSHFCCQNAFVVFLMAGEGSAFLSFQKGDLIILESEDGEDVMKTGWSVGKCERTHARGDFPAECVYVLPTLTRPPNDVLVRSNVGWSCEPRVTVM